MNGPLRLVLDRLESSGCRPRTTGDAIRSLCPGCQLDGGRHDPGLHVSAGDRVPVRLYCHGPGKCEPESILQTMDFQSWGELYGGNGTHAHGHTRTEKRSPEPPADLDPKVVGWSDALWREPEALDFLRSTRGLSDKLILEARLGHDGERFTVPVFGADSSVVFVKKYLPGGDPKFITEPKGSEAALYGIETLAALPAGALVVLTEGELDTLRGRSLGYNAVSGTAGAKTWRDKWSADLARFEVVVIGDHDRDGAEMNRRACESIRKAGGYAQPLTWPAGTPAKTDPTDYTVTQGHSPEEFRALVETALAAGRLRALDLSRVLTEPEEPVPWIVPGWLAAGDVVCLAGEPKTGKSWIALALALALARGGRWLGYLDVKGEPQRVLYCDEENNPSLVRRRIRKLALGLGIGPDELASLPLRYLSRNRLNLTDPDRLQALWREVRSFRPGWTVFDSLIRFHRQDENSNTGMASFFADVVQPLASTFASGVLAVHHLAKPGKERPAGDLPHRVRGASDILAAVDSLWTLEGGADRRTLRRELGREVGVSVGLSISIEDLEAGGVLLVGVEAAGMAAVLRESLDQAGPAGALRQELIKVVEAHGSKDAPRLVSKALGKMFKDGSVRKRRDGGAGVRYWLADHAPDDAESSATGNGEGAKEGMALRGEGTGHAGIRHSPRSLFKRDSRGND